MKDSIIPVGKQSDSVHVLEHMDQIAGFEMRLKDAEEALAATGENSPERALAFSIQASDRVWFIKDPGQPIAGIFGYAKAGDNAAVPWLLGAPHAPGVHPVKFAKVSKRIVDTWSQQFKLLFNFVIADYQESIRWLKFLGFTVSEEIETLQDPNKPFRRFWRYT